MPTYEPFPTTLTQIAGHSISELAAKYATPFYVYDAKKIVQRINDLKPFDVVRYAQKACSNLAILDRMRRNGVLVDSVSAGEVHRALAAGFKAGQEPPQIVFTADLFDHDAFETLRNHKVPVNCGSPDMLIQYGELAKTADLDRNITLRINPGFGHGHSQKTNTGGTQSKHGIWHEQISVCIALAAEYGLTIAGLHMHIGSGTDMKHLSQVCGAMEKVARQVGSSVTMLSTGGGLPIPYKSDETFVDIQAYYDLWDKTRNRLVKEFGHPISLEIEPGRYLAAEAGYLVTEIRAIKRMGENLFYLVDAGFNNLARPILYGAYHPIGICRTEAGSGTEGVDEKLVDVIVGGPLCESGDIFTQTEGGFVASRPLPIAKVGDLLVLGCAGAYGFCMSSNYNSKPMVAEVLLENGQDHLIRKRQTFENLYENEIIPTHS